jgi:hypothetical protein
MAELQKERFDQPGEFDQYLGHLDLEKHPLWEKAWLGQDQKAFEQVLYELGADLGYGYEFSVCNYMPRTSNRSEYGMRVSFRERSDKVWVDTMMCVSDIVRHTHNSLRATGMRQCLNEDNALNDVMIEQAQKFAINVDIKCDLGELNDLNKASE